MDRELPKLSEQDRKELIRLRNRARRALANYEQFMSQHGLKYADINHYLPEKPAKK